MAIQVRRGVYSRFDPTRLLPGEWAVVQSGDSNVSDGKAVYICFAAGDVKRIATVNDMAEYLDNMTAETIEEITAEITAATEAAQGAAVDAEAAKDDAEAAAADARLAADAANQAADAAEEIVDYQVPRMSPTQRGGAKLGSGLEVDADEKLNLKPATVSAIGGVKPDGTTITADADGTLHGSSSYELPTMSASVKGGAKVGTGLAMSGEALGLSGESYTSAEKQKLAGIAANANNYSLPTMSTSTKGGAKLGDGLHMDGEALNLGPLTDSGSGASVETDGVGIFGVQGEGWSEQDTTTGKNLLNYDAFKTVPILHGTAVWENGGVTLTATSNDCYTNSEASGATVSISPGDTVTMSWDCEDDAFGLVYIFPNGTTSGMVYANANTKKLSYTAQSGVTFFTFRFGVSGTGSTIHYSNLQLEAGSTATSYEPYTGGIPSPNPDYPQEIRVARGRNLFDIESYPITQGFYIQASSGASVSDNDLAATIDYIPCEGLRGKTITLNKRPGFSGPGIAFYDSAKSYLSGIANGGATANTPWTFTVPTDAVYMRFSVPKSATDIQLELGTQATPYVPYGHIGLDITANGHTTTTPIPLPAKGFLGALPDGTKDTLAIDSAGRVEWVNACGIVTPKDFSLGQAASYRALFVTQDVSSHGWGTSDVPPILASHMVAVSYSAPWEIGTASVYTTTGGIVVSVDPTVNTQALFASTYPTLEVLYPLAEQTTESTYIQLPELPEGATVSIPELEAIGVEWWVDGTEAMAEHGRDTSKAAHELSEKMSTLEAAVATLATS